MKSVQVLGHLTSPNKVFDYSIDIYCRSLIWISQTKFTWTQNFWEKVFCHISPYSSFYISYYPFFSLSLSVSLSLSYIHSGRKKSDFVCAKKMLSRSDLKRLYNRETTSLRNSPYCLKARPPYHDWLRGNSIKKRDNYLSCIEGIKDV